MVFREDKVIHSHIIEDDWVFIAGARAGTRRYRYVVVAAFSGYYSWSWGESWAFSAKDVPWNVALCLNLNKTRRDNSRHNEGTQLETHSCLSCRGRGTLHPIALRSGLQTGWLLQRADISAGTISLWALLVVSADDIINVNDYGIIRSSYLHFISSATDVRPITRLLSRRTSSCLKVKKNISQN